MAEEQDMNEQQQEQHRDFSAPARPLAAHQLKICVF